METAGVRKEIYTGWILEGKDEEETKWIKVKKAARK